MKPVAPPEFLTIYMLLQQSTSSMYFMPTGAGGTMGSGIFPTRDQAEQARTLAILSDKSNNIFHVFELEVPNPAHKN